MKNIKKIMVLLSLTCVFIKAFSESTVYVEYELGYDTLEINGMSVTYTNRTGMSRGAYVYPDKLVLTAIPERKDYLFLQDESGSKKGILLKNEDFVLMYFSDEGFDGNSCYFAGLSETSHKLILQGMKISASGYLTEKTREYKPDNLLSFRIHTPWVENDDEYGIGEYIEIELSGFYGERLYEATGFFIVNGFVSLSNPTLYEKNSRVKSLKLIDLSSGSEWYQDIDDSPYPQYVDCRGHEGANLQIMIDDVYPGTIYKDTCISNIILVR